MAEIIPALTKEVLARMTAGEKRFAQRLKDLLEDDYLVWYDIPVGRERRYPDFIILHPARGLLFIEVKDWKPETLVGLDKHQAQLQMADGLKKVANPLEQARQCMIQVVNRLKQDPQMLFAEGSPFAGKICMPYGYGAVFTNITRKQIQNGVSDADRELVLPDSKVIYKDEMTESADAETFQQRLWDMFQFRFGEKLSLPQIDRIRWHLFPEVRIRLQDDLFGVDNGSDNSAATELVAEIPDITRIMDVQQEQLARSLGSGHRVIHGVAGSGKTLILGYRAELLAATSSKPTLILCYNISLARKLKAIMSAKGLSERVSVMHFHDWCGVQLKTYHVDLVPGDAPHWEKQVTSVIQGVEAGHIPRAQYGAVLIDEGHDFEAEWLKLITQMIDPESDSLLLLYDDAQSIYNKRSGLGFSLSSVGIKAQGRTTILRLNYRNTREILAFAYQFSADVLGAADSDDDHIPLLLPESAGNHGPEPKVVRLSAWADELAYTVSALKAWHKQGLAWNEMAVLYANKFQGGALARVLKEAGIPAYWLGTSEYKKAYDPSKDQVAIMAIHSSKGLEFPAVIVTGADALNADEQLEQNVRLLYVGMTRAQRHLELTMSDETPLTRRWLSA
ncbi:3'-5' exonuclease [Venatoribacter cucullus]|uniref:3'-5' exonuclease n=1 Tax=Venatoribacter cucullus TaxID=2661630 RepID=UPI0022407DE6|nr:3'-5' exonuclease [Venatoribacter cucullus]UZK03483.1 AAA family ATPase [Venatoribacter cucullus]